ncbi:MAG: hypothetical protein PHC75_06420 [Burkholderiales bacterium]|nr:hypothetical protein [Burkholderiales bacterium]
MKKLLLTLLAGASCIAVASPASFPIQCNNSVTITATSTLGDVQQCLIKKQKTSKGLYEVKFEDNNNHTYTCKFATSYPDAQINSCED